MKLKANVEDIKSAFKKMVVNIEGIQQPFRFITIIAEGNMGAVFALDQALIIRAEFAAEVEEPGFCQVSSKFGKILDNLPDMTVALRTTDKNLTLEGTNGFRSRMQTIDAASAPYAKVMEKLNNSEYTTDVTLDRKEMISLLNLSRQLPASSATTQPWIVMISQTDRVYAESQSSEIGAIEEYPFTVSNYLCGEDALMVVDSEHMLNAVQLCGPSVRVRFAKDQAIPVLVTDPDNDLWWGATTQIAGATTQIDLRNK